MSFAAFPSNQARRVAVTALVVIAACTDGNPVANAPARSAAPAAPTFSFNHGGPCPTAVSAADSSCLQQEASARLSPGGLLAARMTPGTFAQVANGPLTIAMIGFVAGFQQFVTQQALGTVDVFNVNQVAAGALTAKAFDVIVLGRSTSANLPPGFRLAIEAEMAAGAGLLTEWNGGGFVWNAIGPSSLYFLFRENDGTLFDWHIGAVDRGDCQWIANCASAPFTISNAIHPVTSGLPAQFTVPGMEFCFRVSNADPSLDVLATVPDLVGGGTKPVMLAGARGTARVLYFLCDWNDNGISSAILRTWLANALAWVAEPANTAPVADAGGPYTGNEGSAISFDGSGSSDPDGDALTYSWDFGDGSTGTGVNPSHAYGDNGSYTVQLTVDDGRGGTHTSSTTATIANVAPDLGTLNVPAAPIALAPGGSVVNLSATFTDPGFLDTHTGSLNCDGGSAGSVTASGGNASGSCTFATAGVYSVALTVADDDGGSDTEAGSAYIVIYDPSAGFVTGGGWIMSPAGAYVDDASLTGKATFGFVSKYQKGATTPTGHTQFQFHAGSFDFSSTAYSWLVIAGARAQYKGAGTIGGRAGTYGFLLTAIDGQVAGGGGTDKFRIKIWDQATGNIVYDNQLGQLEDSGAATALGGGSIVIHAK